MGCDNGEECAFYSCEECGYSVQDLDSLKVHRLEHNGNADTMDITCFIDLIEDSNISQASHQDICETYIQNTATVLTVQRRIVQNSFDEGPFDDELCEFKTKYPNNLDRRIKVQNKNKKRKHTSSRDESPQKKKLKIQH